MSRRLFSTLLALGLTIALVGGIVTSLPAAPVRDTLVVSAGVQFTTFDPLGEYHPPAVSVLINAMDKLVDRDSKGALVPMLAESWTVSSDGFVWSFKLRRGVKFHDGTPFNADAVKANFDRMTDQELGLPKTRLWSFIKEVKVAGEFEVQIVTEEPYGAMLATLTHSSGVMTSPAAIKRFGRELSTNVVGTGAYRFQTPWAPGRDIVLLRNDEYWGPKPKIARIVVKEVREPLTRQALLERGDVDVVIDLPPDGVLQLQGNPNIVIRKDTPTRTSWLALNLGRKQLSDIRVRKAIKYAINVKGIARTVLRDLAWPSDNLIAPGVVGYTPDPDYHEYSPDKARALLAEAGYANGFDLRAVTTDGRYLKDKEIMIAIQDQLRRVGIRMEVVPLEWTTYLSTIRAADAKWDVYFWSWASYTGDAAYNAQRLLWSAELPPKGYVPFYKNAEVDRLIDRARYITDQTVRARMLEQALKLARADHPYIYLFLYPQITVHGKRVVGIEVNLDENHLFHKAELR